MSRKRSRKLKQIPKKEAKKSKSKITKKKNIKAWIPIALVGIFFLVLMMNSFFNFQAGEVYNMEGETLGTRFFLQGPDPYYNMRTCEVTLETGVYPFLTPETSDPLLNYPVGLKGGARPPLFNMIAVGSASVLENFMPTMDALGWSMLFLPAIYGALLVFPVYKIGKELFNRKVGIISAFFIPLIPTHISGGHGSNLALFDHDSFILLLFAITFFFVIKLVKEKTNKSYLYAILVGVSMGAIQISWAAGQVILLLVVGYMLVQLFFDILKNKYHIRLQISMCLAFLVAFLMTYPYYLIKEIPISFALIGFVASLAIVLITLLFYRLKWPAILVFPTFIIFGGIGLSIVYLAQIGFIKGITPLSKLAEVIFGVGIYGNKVSLTIAEAHTFGLSQIAMMIGPALLWVGLVGFVLYIYKTHKSGYKSESLFVITIFIMQIYLLSTAGRFLNDLIPLLLVFNGFMIFNIVNKLDYKSMIRSIKAVNGIKDKIKCFKPLKIAGIIFIAFIIIVPNSYLALDAATPASVDKKIFGEDFKGYFGGGVGEQIQWADACYWLSQQDTEIENDGDKPAILTWWDYGFYLASMSEHPTVADNYQDGIYAASNFHTAQSEKEATAVLIIRLVQGTKDTFTKNNAKGEIDKRVKNLFREYLGNESENFINIMEDPITYAPSYNTLVAEEYGNKVYRVREHNAMYHDGCKILTNLTDNELTWLYLDTMYITGYSIRYYGIESRDISQIFGVFPFLADKSTHQYSTLEDDFFRTVYVDVNTGNEYTNKQLENMTIAERSKLDLTLSTTNKEAFYNSMIYKTYYGESNDNRVPTLGLKHWRPVYIGPAIFISKYYAGAKINGTAFVDDIKYDGSMVYVLDEYGIQHDSTMVKDGKFDLIVPAGNITLILGIRGQKISTYNIGEVSEEQAMREEGLESDISFKVNYSSIEGNITGLNETAMINITSLTYKGISYSKEVSNGVYSFENMIPDLYDIKVSRGNDTFFSKTQFLKPESNIYNITIEG